MSDRKTEIQQAYRRHGGNIHAVARELGISLTECRSAFPQTPVVVRAFPDDTPRPSLDARGHLAVGRERLRPHIVSVRHAYAGWPEDDRQALQQARQRYDAGTHIMIQGRDGQWIIQYLLKRRKPIPPFNYFYGGGF